MAPTPYRSEEGRLREYSKRLERRLGLASATPQSLQLKSPWYAPWLASGPVRIEEVRSFQAPLTPSAMFEIVAELDRRSGRSGRVAEVGGGIRWYSQHWGRSPLGAHIITTDYTSEIRISETVWDGGPGPGAIVFLVGAFSALNLLLVSWRPAGPLISTLLGLGFFTLSILSSLLSERMWRNRLMRRSRRLRSLGDRLGSLASRDFKVRVASHEENPAAVEHDGRLEDAQRVSHRK